jgi:hypothetical protein
MESISQLVSDSLARHGMETSLDHLRIEWSRWFRCESSFSVLLVPAKPGIFALGEEMVPAGSSPPAGSSLRVEQGFQPCIEAAANKRALAPEVTPSGKRMLALFQISEAGDLGMALGRLFLPGNPLLRKLNSGRCFARYAVIEDAAQRSAAYASFQRWMQESAETASGINSCGAHTPVREIHQQEPCGEDTPVRADVSGNPAVVQKRFDSQPSNSSAWGVGLMEVQNREAKEAVRRPTPLPSGF